MTNFMRMFNPLRRQIRLSFSSMMLPLLLLIAASLSYGEKIHVDAYVTSCDSDGNAISILKYEEIQGELSNPISLEAKLKEADEDPIESGMVAVNIDIETQFQRMVGFGAGLPQSSAYVLTNLKSNNPDAYAEVMRKLFHPSEGAALSTLRFPLGSCDFSLTNTSFDEVAGDYSLESFSIDVDSELIAAVLQDALALNPNITLMASPWSAPSWLKQWGSLLGLSNENTLLDSSEAYDTYAAYLTRAVEAFAARGLHIAYLMLQNEPLFGDNDQYPGMYLSAAQASRLGSAVKNALENSKSAGSTQLLTYDHNWDHPEYPLEVLSAQETAMEDNFAGTAWHCYGGNMTVALDFVGGAFPGLEQHITECTGSYPDDECDIDKGMAGFGGNHAWDMQNVFLGPAAHGSASGTKWVLALDENCGPVLPGVAFTSGRPLVSVPSDLDRVEDARFNQDYWTAAHMSRFVLPGTVRVSSSVSGNGVLTESFLDPRTQRVTCVAMNDNHVQPRELQVSQGTAQLNITLPAWGTVVLQWQAAGESGLL
jgi:glucosylceramidase